MEQSITNTREIIPVEVQRVISPPFSQDRGFTYLKREVSSPLDINSVFDTPTTQKMREIYSKIKYTESSGSKLDFKA